MVTANSNRAPEADDVLALIDEEADLVARLTRVRRRLDLLISRPSTPAAERFETKTKDLTADEVAEAISVSSATLRRFKIKPSYFAGDTRSPRFDLEDVRRQLRDRGARPTTPEKAFVPTNANAAEVDVSCVGRAGLRSVAGGSR